MPKPESGELFEREFNLGDHRIGMLAEVEVSGTDLHLRDVAVYADGTTSAEVGAAAVLRALRQELLPELRGYGFTLVRITGTRVAGGQRGRIIDLTIRLTEDS